MMNEKVKYGNKMRYGKWKTASTDNLFIFNHHHHTDLNIEIIIAFWPKMKWPKIWALCIFNVDSASIVSKFPFYWIYRQTISFIFEWNWMFLNKVLSQGLMLTHKHMFVLNIQNTLKIVVKMNIKRKKNNQEWWCVLMK